MGLSINGNLVHEFGYLLKYYTTNNLESFDDRSAISKIKDKTIFFKANHTEIADFMNATDISVLASIPTKKWVEQYGRVVPEAMACGNRVIISDVGAQNEFFSKDYHYKFSHTNSDKLQDLIEESFLDFKNGLVDRESESLYSQENFGINKQLMAFFAILNKYD